MSVKRRVAERTDLKVCRYGRPYGYSPYGQPLQARERKREQR